MKLTKIEGGVCAAKGFAAGGIHCGIRKNRKKRDIALIVSEKPAAAAAVYTQNLVKGAPILVTKKNIENGVARAIVCNSGNANTCNKNGVEIAEQMCALAGMALGISSTDVVVASTGVIGQPLSIEPIKAHMAELAASLSPEGSGWAAEAIMTTDTKKKEVSYAFTVGGVECHIGAIGKGSGMIHPNMATMLVFVTTDCAISPAMLQKALNEDVKTSFNMVSIDGDTSTNDTVAILANGMAENPEITEPGADFDAFAEALSAVTTDICRRIAGDGEGATKLLTCVLTEGADEESARKVAKSVICSSLTKAAMFGADANWGRILCAIGYSGVDVDVTKVDVSFKSRAGEILVCQNGTGVDFSEEKAKTVLSESEIDILVSLHAGKAQATAWGCDLTYDYVKINGDYRT